MYDLICDVISSCDMGKINVYEKIVIENLKRRTYENHRNLYINTHLIYGLGTEFAAC